MTGRDGYHLTPKQVICRVVSIITCGFGVAACAFSLSLQVEEMGTLLASVVWFSGLACVVAAVAGYAAACDAGAGKSYPFLALLLIAGIAVPVFFFECAHLYPIQIIEVTLVALAVEAVLLVTYHLLLVREAEGE